MKIFDITNPQELLEYMNENIRYGWLDKDNVEHIDTMKGFRDEYHTLTNGEVIINKLGTCIEQTNLEVLVMSNLHIPYKAYCLRSYEDDPNIVEPKMHCFLLYFENDKCYHFEHSNPEKRGIHEYENEEQALNDILSYYQERDKGETRQLVQMPIVEPNMSWHEWNAYLDAIAEENKKCL